ncbi:response regulator transcription factor [Burkholderia perseverans]|uniref:response regulator transcription factor n=1 Tax=Burkholderia perseverans TaxID=2615214 RepID=UPI001FED8BE5|nr:response regulator transcription factor [Burkholderia perseverans]
MTLSPSINRRIRVALADDHPLIAAAMTKLLSETPSITVVHVSHSGAELLQQLRADPCELIITDLSMGTSDQADHDGLKLVSALRKNWPSARVIVYTALNHPALAQRLLHLGAHAVVCKEDSLDELLAAIDQVAVQGNTYLSKQLCGAAPVPASALTPRELEVLRHIGCGLSVVDISRRMFVTVSTVSTHKRNAMDKLNIRSTVELIQYIHAAGLANLR